MPRRKNNNHNNDHRARGGSRGANGRGRGEPNHARGLPTPPTTTTRHPYPHANAEIDVAIQQWQEPPTDVVQGATGSRNPNKGRVPWNGAQRARPGGTPSRGTASPRRGALTPRGRGRGRGRPEDAGDLPFAQRRARFGGGKTPQIGKGATLSDQLYAERPLLRPVKFVRATLTPFLFQRPEDVLKSAVDVADATEGSHVPTADRVAQLFRGAETSDSDSEPEHRVEDALEEIDFADLGQIRAAVDAIARDAATARMNQDVHEDEDMEEVDFADLGAMRAKVDASPPRTSSRDDIIQDTFTGVYKQSRGATRVSNTLNGVQQTPPISSSSIHHQDVISLEQESNGPHDVPIIEPPPPPLPPPDPVPHPRFFVDTTPTRPRGASEVILVDRTGHDYVALGNDPDDELIVYVAPHPRSRRSPSPVSPPVPRVKLPQTSMLTGRVVARPEIEVEMRTDGSGCPGLCEEGEEGGAALSLASLRIESEPELEPEPADVPRARTAKAARRARQKDAVRKRTRQRQLKRRGQGFGAYGAIMSEAMLREDEREKGQAKWKTRRRGDSDLDWGTEGEVDPGSDGGMEVDADVDVTAMQAFVESMSAEGSRFVTADDIEDELQTQCEDEDDSSMPDENSDDEDEEEEEVFDAEEQRLIAESEGESSEESSDDDDDDDLSPRSSFQARLRKIRQQSRGRRQPAALETSDEDDEDAPEVLPRTRSAEDDFYADIQNLLEENSRILSDRDQARAADEWDMEKYLDDPEYTMPVNWKRAQRKKWGKGKQPQTELDSDAELQAMWERDRAKKAAYKRARNEARLRAALDPLAGPFTFAFPFPDPSKGKGKGKASRKAMRAAARLDPKTALALAPRAIVDATSLEAQLRRFAAGGGGLRSMALPPMDKSARKMVHEMAAAFGIQSVSKGQGDGRYATLVRTATTGVGVREGRVRAVVKRYAGVGKGGGEGKREGKGRVGAPKHREGDEVGKEAPKIGAGNVGFKMLASMGWSEGDRIGLTGSAGLEAPLTAIIKHSKLGLGATRERE